MFGEEMALKHHSVSLAPQNMEWSGVEWIGVEHTNSASRFLTHELCQFFLIAHSEACAA